MDEVNYGAFIAPKAADSDIFQIMKNVMKYTNAKSCISARGGTQINGKAERKSISHSI